MIPFDWRLLPPLPALRAFEAAARLGSFSAAARVLNVTHPAVAQQVRGLERHLGLRLVAGAARSLTLTEDGARLAAALNGGFAGIAETLTSLTRADQHRGLRVTLTPGMAQNVVMPALPEFWAAHPEIAVSLVPSLTVDNLARDGFDLALRVGGGDWPDGEAQLLCHTRMVLVGTPALLARNADLARLPWIVDSDYREAAEWMAVMGLDHRRVQMLELTNPMLAVDACLRGLGLMFATAAVMREALATGQLQVVPGWDHLPERAYWAVLPPGPTRAPVQDFLRWLKSRF